MQVFCYNNLKKINVDNQAGSNVNNYIGGGINAIDINIDRFAIIELDSNGNLLKRKVIPFYLDGLSSNQSTKLLEKVVLECIDFCKQNNKPLVREDIKKIKFKVTKLPTKITTTLINCSITIENCGTVINLCPCIYPFFTLRSGTIKSAGSSIHRSVK